MYSIGHSSPLPVIRNLPFRFYLSTSIKIILIGLLFVCLHFPTLFGDQFKKNNAQPSHAIARVPHWVDHAREKT